MSFYVIISCNKKNKIDSFDKFCFKVLCSYLNGYIGFKTDCNYYQNKILKLENQIAELKEKNEKYKRKKNEIEIIFFDKNENKEKIKK